MLFVGSSVPAFLWGVAMANIFRGVSIDANMTYVGSFWDLLNPFALIAGVTSLVIFALHGANFISIKIEGSIADRANAVALKLWPVAIIAGLIVVGMGYFETDMYTRHGIKSGLLPLIAGAATFAAGWFLRRKRNGWAFAMTSICIVFATITIFTGLYPRVLISSLQPEAWSLTIYNASSSAYTLRVMSIITLIFLPLVLLYQGWSYHVFRRRITRSSSLEY